VRIFDGAVSTAQHVTDHAEGAPALNEGSPSSEEDGRLSGTCSEEVASQTKRQQEPSTERTNGACEKIITGLTPG
jgi:hypothetical protein